MHTLPIASSMIQKSIRAQRIFDRMRVERVANFVRSYLMRTGKRHDRDPWGPNYRWEHTLRVARWAWILAYEEDADIEKCILSALFHDVSHFVAEEYRKHGEKSAEIATRYMTKTGSPKDLVEGVSYAIKSHVGERNPATKEAKILQDADTLDRFGLFRILLFGRTADLSNLFKLATDIKSFLAYLEKVEQGEFGPMWTKKGKEKMIELIDVYRAVYGEILSEIENTKAPKTYV